MGVKKRKKLTKKQIEKNKVMNLFVSNLDGIEIVQLKSEYSNMFINRFGLETIPTKERFLEFKNAIN